MAVLGCPADFLVASIEAMRNVEVDHRTHVLLINPQSKRVGSHHEMNIASMECMQPSWKAAGPSRACVGV